MKNNTRPKFKHRNFNHTQVNILNCAVCVGGAGFIGAFISDRRWTSDVLFRRPSTIRRSFQTRDEPLTYILEGR